MFDDFEAFEFVRDIDFEVLESVREIVEGVREILLDASSFASVCCLVSFFALDISDSGRRVRQHCKKGGPCYKFSTVTCPVLQRVDEVMIEILLQRT